MAFSGTFYGFRPVGSYYNLSNLLIERKGGGIFAKGDLVMPDGLGEAIIATAAVAAPIYGVANEAATGSSTGVQINATPGLVVIADNDNVSATFSASLVDSYFEFIGATGAMGVDTTTANVSTRMPLYCIEYNPQGYGKLLDADTSIGKYVLRELMTDY